jgi:predicted DNA-binding transcriptional regulator AlpA
VQDKVETKAVVTVSEMARIVHLSRARFYQLIEAGVFPTPVYFVSNRRPFFDEEMQKVCLEVRRRNCGINGQPVLFYASNGHQTQIARTRTKPASKTPKTKAKHTDIVESLSALGMAASDQDVSSALQTLYPNGTNNDDRGNVLRSIFLHLKRQDSGDNVGR